MTKILIVAEHAGGKLNPATAKCVACASKIEGAEIDVAVFAADASAVAAQAAALQGVKKRTDSRESRERRTARSGARTAGCRSRRELHPRVRPVDDVRQGPACRASPPCSASAN